MYSIKKSFIVASIPCVISFFSAESFAIEYYEMEVYGYQTANRHELEIENTSSLSSDDREDFTSPILRSTFEFNYGFSDRWEATAYFDYTKPAEDHAEFTAFRTHARTYFFEKDEMPIDLGAYLEAEFPRNFRAKDVGLEFRPIIEKDISRWTLRLNPSVELSHVAKTLGENSVAVDPDGDVVGVSNQSLSSEKYWMVEWNLSSGVSYNLNSRFQPHLDWHTGLTDGSSLVMPGIDMKIMKGLKADVGVGFGLNSNTETRLLVTRFEFESFLDN